MKITWWPGNLGTWKFGEGVIDLCMFPKVENNFFTAVAIFKLHLQFVVLVI